MKFLIVSDPTEGLKARTDTALAFARAAIARGHRVSWATARDVGLSGPDVHVSAREIESLPDGALPRLARAGEPAALHGFDGVWIRRDPPFDAEYVSLCWILQVEESRVRFINRPSLLLRLHEKLIPVLAVRAGLVPSKHLVPTLLTASYTDEASVARIAGEGPGGVVTKPWYGFAGHDVHVWDDARAAYASLAREKGPLWERALVQPLIPEVKTAGDRRVFFIDGRVRGDFVRLPRKGSWISNLARGGSAESRPMSAAEREICEGLGAFLKREGVAFAGADLLAGRLSEVNITAPTGVVTLKELGGPDLAQEFVQLAEGK